MSAWLCAVLLAVAADPPPKGGENWDAFPQATPATVVDDTARTPPPAFGQAWSVVGARTTGNNGNLLDVGGGFPGGHVSYLHGILPNLDIGIRAEGDYALQGQVTTLAPGFQIQAQVKYRFLDSERVSLAVTFAPGPLFSFPGRQLLAGAVLPIGLRAGIVASSAINVAITFEVPFWVSAGETGTAVIPVLTGAGFEYFITSALNVWLTIRMGPSLYPNGDRAQFTLDSRLGVGWHF